jgi:ribonuclease BN (tRNA processing enzyme)
MWIRFSLPVLFVTYGAVFSTEQLPAPSTIRSVAADSVTIVTLGTGTPVPNPRAAGAATAVVVGSRVLLFDAGSGIERQLNAARLPVNGVEAVFFTHLHSDHVLGYPDLIFTSWVFGRRTPLKAFGPPGLKLMTDHLIAAFADDIHVRTTGLERAIPGGYRVTPHEVTSGVVYDSAGVRVTAFPVDHGAWKVALGYRIDANGRSIVISGDARPTDRLVDMSANVDVLVHEVYAASGVRPQPFGEGGDWPKYLASAHTSDVELGVMAAKSNPRLVILTHVIGLGVPDSVMIAAVKSKGFAGRVAVAHDLDRF